MSVRAGAVFLDRDGTLIHDAHYIGDPNQVRLLPGVAEVLVALEQQGVPRIVVTNQSGIARGMFTESDYVAVHERFVQLLAERGAGITAAYHCPHHPEFTGACACRKPGTLLFERAAAELNIDLEASLFVGDRWRDVQPGLSLGGTGALVRSHSTPKADVDSAIEAGVLAESLAEAVSRWQAGRGAGRGREELARSSAGAATQPGAARLQSGVMKARIAVLASGGGSNLQALLDHQAGLGEESFGKVELVASDKAAAKCLERARTAGIATEVMSAPHDGRALCELLSAHDIDLVVLAGYLRLVPEEVVSRWPDRIVNVHPALLPSFGGKGMYGMRVHEAVLQSGVKISGPTVHIVDNEYDRGRIVAQWPVPVLGSDTPESLAARVLQAEHILLPRVVELLAARIAGQRPANRAAQDAAFGFTAGTVLHGESVEAFLDATCNGAPAPHDRLPVP